MLMISIPKSEIRNGNIKTGTPVTINGHKTLITLSEVDGHLIYTDEQGVENRCKVFSAVEQSKMPMPDGTKTDCIRFLAASHGQTVDDCVVMP